SLPQAFVVEEKEGFVLLDRAAKRSSKVISLERRNRVSELVGEPIVRVHYGIAEKFVKAAMVLIGSRTTHNVDDRSASEAKLGREVGLLYLEFFDRIYRRNVGYVLNSAVLFEVGRARSVDQNIGCRVPSTVRIEIYSTIRTLRITQVGLGHARSQEGQVREIPVDQREVVHKLPVHHLSRHRVFCLQVHRAGRDFHLLGRTADLQRAI